MMTLSGGSRPATVAEVLAALRKHDPLGKQEVSSSDGELLTALWTETLALRGFARDFMRAQAAETPSAATGVATQTAVGAALDRIEKPHALLDLAKRGGWVL